MSILDKKSKTLIYNEIEWVERKVALEEIERLKNIINRAINFINYCETDVNFGIEISVSTKSDLLDILKGDDKE